MQGALCIKLFGLESCWIRSDNRIGVTMNGTIYHERQVKELCALHALNNLFQESNAFTKSELDSICYTLSPNVWINPHKSFLGLGNYDINVIMAALQHKGCEAVWFDKRKDPKCLNLSNILGFILNIPSDYKLGFVLLPLRRRHWIAIRQIQGDYFNLDSKLESPQCIGKAPDLITYLQEQLECKEKELFVVVSTEVEQNQNWLLSSNANGENNGQNFRNKGAQEATSTEVLSLNAIGFPNDTSGGTVIRSRTIISASDCVCINREHSEEIHEVHENCKESSNIASSVTVFDNQRTVEASVLDTNER